MTNTQTIAAPLHTSASLSEEDWLANWTARAPVLEPEKVDEVLELMGLL
jgi:hypothetical protein